MVTEVFVSEMKGKARDWFDLLIECCPQLAVLHAGDTF